jgi:hypothetical protein
VKWLILLIVSAWALGCTDSAELGQLTCSAGVKLTLPEELEKRDLVAYWRLDDEGPVWRDRRSDRDLTRGSTSALGENSDPECGAHVGMDGRSCTAWFNTGKQYAQRDETSGEYTDADLTLSAWLSLGEDDAVLLDGSAEGTVWPIASTLSKDSATDRAGYQLDIRHDAKLGLAFAFSYWSSGSAEPTVLAAKLPAAEQWKAGDWYHLGATYDEEAGQAAVSLLLDGKVVAAASERPQRSQHATGKSYVFYVGSNEQNEATYGYSRFRGYLGNIALFRRALRPDEVSEFGRSERYVQGPGGHPWATWGIYASYVKEWSCAKPLTVAVMDDKWSAGGVVALLDAEGVDQDPGATELAGRALKRVVLTADLPPDQEFDFSLNSDHGRNACSWILSSRGPGAQPYEIDLEQPKWCRHPDCGFSFGINDVEAATLSTRWGNESQGTVRFTIHDLDLDSTEGDGDTAGLNRGFWGLNGWCWRPISYDAASTAELIPSPGQGDSVSATLSGEDGTTARLEADFGAASLDLSGCQSIEVEADLPGNPKGDTNASKDNDYTFVLVSSNDATREWSLLGSGLAKYVVNLQASGNPAGPPGHTFAIEQVKELGIQKPWQAAWSNPVRITINKVTFVGDTCNQPNSPPSDTPLPTEPR